MGKPKAGTIYVGDCVKVMRMWDDAVFDCCIADPPYNIARKGQKGLFYAFSGSGHVTMHEKWDQFSSRKAYLKFSKKWLSEVCRVVKSNGNIFVFGSYHSIYDLGHLIHNMGLKMLNSIVWFKPDAQPNISCRMLTESTEYIIWFCNGPKEKATRWTFNYKIAKELNEGKQMRNVWIIPKTIPKEKQHSPKYPAQKPIAVIKRIIQIATRPGDLILDCFGGTGTTAVVAQELDRRWVLVEKDAGYVEIAVKRLEAMKGEDGNMR